MPSYTALHPVGSLDVQLERDAELGSAATNGALVLPNHSMTRLTAKSANEAQEQKGSIIVAEHLSDELDVVHTFLIFSSRNWRSLAYRLQWLGEIFNVLRRWEAL